MKISPKKLFLIDGLGAFLTAFTTGVILANLEAHIGMPKNVLYPLAVIACFFAVYSFWNHLQMVPNWPMFMNIIAIANLVYCSLTLGLAIYHRATVTSLGFAYFGLEVVVVVSLAIFELKTARTNSNG
ncbi:MAG TPA: hypothetical protein DCS93_00635 [Microscillaceae bacterium]|nr:hypothetical protein [Microscillaceae bacterium]